MEAEELAQDIAKWRMGAQDVIERKIEPLAKRREEYVDLITQAVGQLDDYPEDLEADVVALMEIVKHSLFHVKSPAGHAYVRIYGRDSAYPEQLHPTSYLETAIEKIGRWKRDAVNKIAHLKRNAAEVQRQIDKLEEQSLELGDCLGIAETLLGLFDDVYVSEDVLCARKNDLMMYTGRTYRCMGDVLFKIDARDLLTGRSRIMAEPVGNNPEPRNEAESGWHPHVERCSQSICLGEMLGSSYRMADNFDVIGLLSLAMTTLTNYNGRSTYIKISELRCKKPKEEK